MLVFIPSFLSVRVDISQNHNFLSFLFFNHFTTSKMNTSNHQSGINVKNINYKEELYCYCHQPEDERKMIRCETSGCIYEWFHIECLNISTEQVESMGTFICSYCMKHQHPLSTDSIMVDEPIFNQDAFKSVDEHSQTVRQYGRTHLSAQIDQLAVDKNTRRQITKAIVAAMSMQENAC